jgi:hypothetical protein
MKFFPKKLRAILIASPLVFSAQSVMAGGAIVGGPIDTDASFEAGCNSTTYSPVSGSLTSFLDFISKNSSCKIGDKDYSAFTLTNFLDQENTFLRISKSGALGTNYSINISNNSGLQPGPYKFNYTVAVSGTSNFIDKWVATTQNQGIGNDGYSLKVTSTDPFNPSVSQTINQNMINGNIQDLVNQPTTVAFSNDLTVGISKDGPFSFTNTVVQAAPPSQVPGPLPLLGAGAAFGFSRKLRARIKTKA